MTDAPEIPPGETIPLESLKVGDIIVGQSQHEDRGGEWMVRTGVTLVTVLRDAEPWTDMFGREMSRYWARRHDTDAEGYLVYGPGAIIERAPA